MRKHRAESVEGPIAPSSEALKLAAELSATTTKSTIGLSLSNYAEVLKSGRKSTLPIETMNKYQTNLLTNASCKDFSALGWGDHRRSENVEALADLGKTFRELHSVRSTANFRMGSQLNTDRYHTAEHIPAVQAKYGANIMMKSVSLSRKLDQDRLRLEDKVNFR